MADQLKAKGNAAFSAKKYEEAIGYFTEAIALEPTNHVFYSNRSACYSANQQYEKALEDGNKIVEVKVDWAKGYSRKGAALQGLGRIDEAIETFEQGLQIDPSNAALKKALDDIQKLAQANPFNMLAQMFNSPALWSKIATSPSMAPYRNDPAFIEKIKLIQQDPSSLSEHISHPGVTALLSEFMGMRGGPGASAAPQQPKQSKPKQPEPEPETEEDLKKKQAVQEKAKGNEFYKKKDFDNALKYYNAAIELDPSNCTFYSNVAAVHFEMADYEKCRELCKKAIDIGHENYADYKVIAKILSRIGNAYFKEDKLDLAIEYFNKSLTECRSKAALDKLNQAEKIIKQRNVDAYIDPEISLQEKAKAAELFKAGKFPDAIKGYTEAILRNPKDHTLYSNRAATYMKLLEYPSAIKDCDRCVEIKPDFVKALMRKATCYQIMKEYDLCFKAYEQVKKLDPSNQEAEIGMQRAMITQQMEHQRRAEEAKNGQ